MDMEIKAYVRVAVCVLSRDRKEIYVEKIWDKKKCLIGGKLKIGESPLNGLKRELEEEGGHSMSEAIMAEIKEVGMHSHAYTDGKCMLSEFCFLYVSSVDKECLQDCEDFAWFRYENDGSFLPSKFFEICMKEEKNV